MTVRSLVIMLWLLAAVVFVPTVEPAKRTDVHVIDEAGRDQLAAPGFARVEEPDRTAFSLDALWIDFSYAAAAAGARGCAAIVVGLALFSLLFGLWCRGFMCALRRLVVTLCLGTPMAVALIYTSCFLDGRTIRLGPEATGFVPASLHTQTNRSTGLLSPSEIVSWHYRRGFRVLNVSDKNRIDGAVEARRIAMGLALQPSLLVLIGEEWQGGPDIALVNVQRRWDPDGRMDDTIAGVRREGGATFVAHPWAKVLPRTIDEIFQAGVDGTEVVNNVIHGGSHLIRKALRSKKAMLGVMDYKYGPHINAMTLLPVRLAGTPRGVVEALRSRQTRVLYAVPGGVLSGEQWEAGTLGTSGAVAGLRTLLRTPLRRRAAWYPWLALIAFLWWVATRPGHHRPMSARTARIVFMVCCILQGVILSGLAWQVRELVGSIPVLYLLSAAGLVAVPLIAATHTLAEQPEEADTPASVPEDSTAP